MATIPLPALDLKPPQPQQNPLEQYGNLLQLKNAQQEQQLHQQLAPLQVQQAQQGLQSQGLQIQQQQQALKDQQGVANWYKNIDPSDPDAFNPIKVGKTLAANGVSGSGIMDTQQKLLQRQQTMATLTKDQIANNQAVSDNLSHGIDGVLSLTDPTQRAQAIVPLLQTAVQNKLIDPAQAQQMESNASAITNDQLQQFQHGLGVSAAFMKAAAAKQSADTAKRKIDASMDPTSSLYAPSQAAVALGTAPGAAQIQAGEVRQAANKAGAEESARLPGEMALARQRQALSQGDPNAAGQLLVNGDATLSELKSRGATPDFIAKALFAAHQLSGGKYNAQQADAAFQVAKSPANVAFFGSSRSLTDPGGTLDQLAQVGKTVPAGQIPAFNSLADWEKAATGNGPMAHYAATALGVADDYAKVMGGGQGSDTSRLQALNIIKANASPEARAGAIQGIRNAVISQTNSRIGSNPVLGRMYGAPQQAAPSGSLTVTAPNGKTYTFKDQQSADAFKKNAGIQ